MTDTIRTKKQHGPPLPVALSPRAGGGSEAVCALVAAALTAPACAALLDPFPPLSSSRTLSSRLPYPLGYTRRLGSQLLGGRYEEAAAEHAVH